MPDTFLAIVMSNAVVATLLALVVALLGRLVRRPAFVHALWLLVLLKAGDAALVARLVLVAATSTCRGCTSGRVG